MKPKHFIPPAVALVVAGIWLGNQRQSFSALEEEVAVLRKHIATASAATGSGEAVASSGSNPKASTEAKQPIDWKKTAALIAEMQSGEVSEMRETMRLQRRLQEMSKEELLAALEEIAGMDLPVAVRDALEQTLLNPLAQKDPEMALSRFASKLGDDQNAMSWNLANAMSDWLKKDTAAALRWFDREIASGTFDAKSLDGKNQSRLMFESRAVQSLLVSDPDAAVERVVAYPGAQRHELLRSFGGDELKEEGQAAFAKVARATLPENEQSSVIASQVSRMVRRNGLGAADTYMERIQASPAERTAIVEVSITGRVRAISREKQLESSDIEELRRWSNKHSPESTDRMTGRILGSASHNQPQNRMEQADAIARVDEYHKSTGNDDVVVGYLESADSEDREASLQLAEKIKDPAKREEWTKRLK